MDKPQEEDAAPEWELDHALENIGFGLWQIQLILTLCVSSFADSSESTLLAFLGPCAQDEFDLSYAQTSAINSVVFVGSLLGCMFFGFFADCKGRRAAYALSLFFLFVFGVFTYCSRTYNQLLLCRALVGFGLGGGIAPFDFLAESIPAKVRGICCTFSAVFWGFGSVLTVLAAWLVLDPFGWRGVAFLCTLPVLLAILTLFFLPESPRWLLAQGRQQEAVQAIQRAAKVNGIILGEFSLKEIPPTLNKTGIVEIFKPSSYKTTLLLFVEWAAAGFCYNALVQFSAKLFESRDSGSHCSFSFEEILIPALSEPFMLILAMFWVEKSRRMTLSLSAFSASICLVCLGLPLSKPSLTAIAFLARGFVDIFCSMVWVVTPEYYPTSIRATAHAFFYNVARIGASFSSFWAYSSFSSEIVCGFIAVLCFVSGVPILFLHETAGNVLDQVQSLPNQNQKDNNHGFLCCNFLFTFQTNASDEENGRLLLKPSETLSEDASKHSETKH